jgi:hypothetical protein
MTLSKVDLALAVIAAASLIWIEHDHRVFIGPLAAAEAPAAVASVCPTTDDAPYSPECIKFIGGVVLPATTTTRRPTEFDAPPCPLRDESAPDGDSCLARAP